MFYSPPVGFRGNLSLDISSILCRELQQLDRQGRSKIGMLEGAINSVRQASEY